MDSAGSDGMREEGKGSGMRRAKQGGEAEHGGEGAAPRSTVREGARASADTD